MCAVPVEELSGRDEEEMDTFFMRLKEKHGIGEITRSLCRL